MAHGIRVGEVKGAVQPRHTVQLAGFVVELADNDGILATDAALRLGATLQQLADRAPVSRAQDADAARRQFLEFCRAVTG